ncbi:MAG: orotidine 5-phosphate decarboxylase [Cyanobacteriota bacterium]|jgi:orotidine-5'-phosphate decarboxylase
MEILDRVIIALDFSSLSEVNSFLQKFNWASELRPRFVKVGMELFYAEGFKIIDILKEKNLKIFLDLKVHDIPNTAYGAISSLSRLNVDILNVHASGGIEMMKKAKQALLDAGSTTKLIAVTQLTSTDQTMLNSELGISGDIESAVMRLAKNTQQAGLDGIVCSPLETTVIKSALGPRFITVCPGVRFQDTNAHDQKRCTTPEQAFKLGADYIVIGRAISSVSEPRIALEILSGITD